MKKIITIGGSTSKDSINRKLAESVGGLLKGVEVINIDLSKYELPLFSVDIEKEQGFSKDLQKLNKEIESTDGIILSLAEHNGAYAAAFKNAFDWLSRIEGKVWRNKPMLLLSTSNGARGGQSVMDIALNRFPYNGGNIIGSMTFPSFNKNFQNGQIQNEELLSKITQLSDEFIEKDDIKHYLDKIKKNLVEDYALFKELCDDGFNMGTFSDLVDAAFKEEL